MGPIAYSYVSDGLFAGPVSCQPCKIRLGVYLLPAMATWEKPPEPVNGKMRVWNGMKWHYKDAPKPIVVVSEPMQKSVEVRDNPELLNVVVDNMRASLEERVMKAAGAKLDGYSTLLKKHSEDFDRVENSLKFLRESFQDQKGVSDSFLMEFGAIAQRFKNVNESIDVLTKAFRDLEDTVSTMKSEIVGEPKQVEPTSVSETKGVMSKLKFWS